MKTRWLLPLLTLCVMTAATPPASAAVVNNYEASVLADNPLAYYRFEETSGAIANDTSTAGANHPGSILGNVTLNQASATAVLGSSYAFSTTGTTGRVRITDHADFDRGTNPFTVELWYFTTNDGRGDLFTYKGAGGDFGIHSNSQGDPAGFDAGVSVYFNGFNGPSGNTTGVGANKGSWHHVAVTRGAGGALNIFVDGQLGFAGTNAGTWNIANDLLIGSNHSNDPPTLTPGAGFNGRIDEVAVYDTALNQAQLLRHISAANGGQGSIGINFVGGGGPGNGQDRVLDNADGPAGLVPQINWNNGTGTDNTIANLVNDLGNNSGASITWDSDALYSTGSGSANGNAILMNGYADDNDNSMSTYTVSNVPFGRYDVIVYTDSDAADSRDESFNLMNGGGTDFGTVFVSDESNFAGTFVRATATTINGVGAQGNYVLFENVFGDSFTLTGTSLNFRNFVNGIQILDRTPPPVPEPATAMLGLVGLAGLAVRRRRRA